MNSSRRNQASTEPREDISKQGLDCVDLPLRRLSRRPFSLNHNPNLTLNRCALSSSVFPTLRTLFSLRLTFPIRFSVQHLNLNPNLNRSALSSPCCRSSVTAFSTLRSLCPLRLNLSDPFFSSASLPSLTYVKNVLPLILSSVSSPVSC
jgi:hypothetical protein